MAKVFTGKVIIPGDKIDEYFALLKEAENRRAPFKNQLKALNEEFYESLLAKFSELHVQRTYALIL